MCHTTSYHVIILPLFMLVLCNITNKIRKRTDTTVAFNQEYSRVSYPLRNVSTLSTGSGSSKDTHTGVGGIGPRGLPKNYNICLEEEIFRLILRATGFDWLTQASSTSNNALSYIRTWRVTRARTGLSPPAGYLNKPWDYKITEW